MQKIAELISEDIRERIVEKLNEIEKSSNLSKLDVSAILNKIHFLASKRYVTNQNELWKDVSKLSVDFYLDFEYYKQFTFKSKFSCTEYHDALKNLGFKEINGFWKSYCKPSKTLVINCIVQSCIYRTIMMKMNGEDSVDVNLHELMTINNTSELMEFCPFCDKNLNISHNCEACGATAEEIDNLRNQAKLSKNKDNQLDNDETFVGGGIEVVKNGLLCTKHVDSSDLENERKEKSCNNSYSEEISVTNKLYSKNPSKEARSENLRSNDYKGKSKSSLKNELKEKSCNNSCSEKSKVTEKSDSKNSHDDELSDDHDHVEIFCNTDISSNDLECEGCEQSLVTIYEKEIDKYEKGKIDEIKNNKNRDIDCIANKEVINCDDNKHDKESGSQFADKHGELNLDGNKWKCKRCEVVNEDGNVNCIVCLKARAEWNCRKCTFVNQISNDYCVVCGEKNENKIAKYCSKCKHGDDLCEDCLKARDETWTCWYRLCENRNAGNVKYCQKCGLDRYADKINIGAPMWRCIFDVRDQIWICDKCSHINDISRYFCQNHPCCGEKKYRKMCYKCKYKYNYESSNYCEICKERIMHISRISVTKID